MDVLTLQPSSSTRGPTPPANTDTAIYQYTLNVTKALSKKLDATQTMYQKKTEHRICI